MEHVVDWILMAAMCCFAAGNIDVYVDTKKKESDGISSWLNLAAALIAVITALKIALT